MVKWKVSLMLILAVIVTLSVFFLMGRDKDVGQIKKNLNTLAFLVEKNEKETIIISLAKVQKMASFFLEDCQIEIGSPVPNIIGKDELISTAFQLRQLVNNIEVKLSDISITLEDNTHATSTFVAAVVSSGSIVEGNEVYPRQLEITWEKVGKNWKIKRVKTIEILH